MKDINKILKIIDDISNEQSTNKKIEILSNFFENNPKNIYQVFLKILKNTYDKRTKYYVDIKTLNKIFNEIKNNDDLNSNITLNDLDITINQLDQISSKVPLKNRITGFNAHDLIKENLIKFPESIQKIVLKMLNKDLKIGMNIKNINKSLNEENKIYQTPYNGAETLKTDKMKKNLKKFGKLIVDEKMDGMYAAIAYNYSESRSGQILHLEQIFNKFTEKIDSLFGEKQILIGELLLEETERKIANGIINSYTNILEKLEDFGIDYSDINENTLSLIQKEYQKTDDKKIKKILKDLKNNIIGFKSKYGINIQDIPNKLYYTIWDIIPKKNYEKGYYDKPFIERRKDLEKVFKNINMDNKIKKIKYIIANSMEEIGHFTHQILKEGGEGGVVKTENAKFENKKSNQMKIKIEISLDLKITGFLPGKPGSKFENTLGSIIVESKDKKLITQVSGMTENMRKEIWENKEKYLGKIIEVQANGLSKSDEKTTYSLLHPRFIEIRNDKTEADTLEKIKDNFDMIKQVEKLLGISLDNQIQNKQQILPEL